MRVLLVDDHQIVREGLRRVLSQPSDMLVVGEAPSGEAALELVARRRPEVVLMDIGLPRLDGIGDDRLEVELRFDQRRSLLGDLLRFRGDKRQRVPHIADALANPDHHRPIVNDQTMVVFARDVFGG